MLKIGLTGGIASGKSTVASMLRDLDCPVLAADALGHELLEPGQTAYAEVVREFGIDILDSYGNVDRTALGEIVFADAEKRGRAAGFQAEIPVRLGQGQSRQDPRLQRLLYSSTIGHPHRLR